MAKMRSPNYPAVGLGTAVQMAQALWNKEQRGIVLPEVAVQHWGYKGMNGPARTKLSALRKFGLVEDAGNGIRLTDRALAIIHRSSDYEKAVEDATWAPEIFTEVAQSEVGDGSDQNLLAYLKAKKGFSEAGARQFVEAYRDTLAFAGDSHSGAYDAKPPKQDPPAGSAMNIDQNIGGAQKSPPQSGQVRSVQVPLSASAWATLQAPFPLTEDAWDQMLAVLQAMKPGLVAKSVVLTGDPSTATDPEDALRKATPKG